MEDSEQRLEVIDSDFSGLEGTNCYCSDESMKAIRQAVSGLPLCAIHMIGTGDYHYISLFWLERIRKPFALVLIDNHPDDQPDAFGENLLTCGSWVREARRLPFCVATAWFDGDGNVHTDGDIHAVSEAYLSIDLDVLSSEYAITDWNQGKVSLDQLSYFIRSTKKSHSIIGIDICGGLSPEKGASPADISLNARTEEALINLFRF